MRRDGAPGGGGHADHSPHGPGELRVGRGAQFVGDGAVLPETRRNAEAASGFVDSSGRGEKNHGADRARSRQIIPARADEGFQAAAIADSFESACGEPIETVFIEKCSRDSTGAGCLSRQRAAPAHTASLPYNDLTNP